MSDTPKTPDLVTAPDKPLHLWSREELLAVYPAKPPKPLAKYDVHELVKLKNYGPAVIGGALYLAAQKAAVESTNERLGPAILDKGTKPVPFVSEGR